METVDTQSVSDLPRGSIILGQFTGRHLGDILCISPIPRLIKELYGAPVYIEDEPMNRIVFENNPHFTGFVSGALSGPRTFVGSGHIIQRIEAAFDLPARAVPKPEIYLSANEVEWARSERTRFPSDRGVCVLSTAAVSDRGNAERVAWPHVVRELLGHFTVVQPVLGEPAIAGAFVYDRLSVRRYMALISVADAFVGATSGGSHVAAAFDVPGLIVGWRSLLDAIRFPVAGFGIPHAFLYPQQWHIAVEDVTAGSFREHLVRGILSEMTKCGRGGRSVPSMDRQAHRSAALLPIQRGMIKCGRRWVRVPVSPRNNHRPSAQLSAMA